MIVLIAIFDSEYLPRAIISAILVLAIGYSKPLIEFRKKNIPESPKLVLLLLINIILLAIPFSTGFIWSFDSIIFSLTLLGCILIGFILTAIFIIKTKKK